MAVSREEKKDTQQVTWEQTRQMMEREMPHKSFRPVAGGVLSLVSGYLNVFEGILLLSRSSLFPLMGNFVNVSTLSTAGTNAFAIIMIVLGVISAIGGFYAIARRGYPMAVIGSITSLFPSVAVIPGILSLIFVGTSRSEFAKPK